MQLSSILTVPPSSVPSKSVVPHPALLKPGPATDRMALIVCFSPRMLRSLREKKPNFARISGQLLILSNQCSRGGIIGVVRNVGIHSVCERLKANDMQISRTMLPPENVVPSRKCIKNCHLYRTLVRASIRMFGRNDTLIFWAHTCVPIKNERHAR